MVPSLLFSPDADAQLGALQSDSARSELFDRVNDVLDAIEADPSDSKVRRQRYQTPPLWGVPVYGSGEDWLILWEEGPEESLVHYIGPGL